ncbi:uncharacterized protein N7496_008326 [Penicillium cataractarum]|uniref:Cupin type-2 domain-containing protein n=1 Tax=Penicillium cataractarum TaxID=2100454 RepID=A0A9W9RY73_9EURO|nr:uncharacterized protein N7496_008326 [Penicillium cataractarum]KAJ5368566.1 hypothetical protein N7496_008326 [Penicillium cataractarum]
MSSRSATADIGLRDCTRYITGHNDEAKSVFLPTPDLFHHQRRGYSVARAYTVPRAPAPLDQNTDLELYQAAYDGTEATSCSKEGPNVVVDSGVNSVYIDMTPGAQSKMHRTVSIDLVVVIEGEIELELDSGEKKLLCPGDTVVQRGTMHRWTNPSNTKPARMLAVLVSSENARIGGHELKQEYLPD